MAQTKLIIELDETAAAYLLGLMAKYNEPKPTDMIATALGVMSTLSEFVQDGILTVVDPKATSSDPNEREIELLFERLGGGSHQRAA